MGRRIAVVTGASSGMGREFLLQLDRREKLDEIWAVARREDKLLELRAGLRAALRPVVLDLTDPEAGSVYRELLEREKPEVAVLVNAAGFGVFGAFAERSLEAQLNMIDLNDRALVMMTGLTLPYMPRDGRILQLGSLSSFQPVPYINVYGASKAFVLSYARALNRELKLALDETGIDIPFPQMVVWQGK